MSNLWRVEEFHRVFSPDQNDAPRDLKQFYFRERLIREEFREWRYSVLDKEPRWRQVKELADFCYVVDGTILSYGFNSAQWDLVQEIVHKSNMSKAGSDGKAIRDAGGKVLKGPNYKPADEELYKLIGPD